jgi:hypothetical protein
MPVSVKHLQASSNKPVFSNHAGLVKPKFMSGPQPGRSMAVLHASEMVKAGDSEYCPRETCLRDALKLKPEDEIEFVDDKLRKKLGGMVEAAKKALPTNHDVIPPLATVSYAKTASEVYGAKYHGSKPAKPQLVGEPGDVVSIFKGLNNGNDNDE